MVDEADWECSNEERKQVRWIIDTFDDLMLAGNFYDLEEILKEVDISNTSSTVLFAYVLAGSWAYTEYRGTYDKLYKAVYAHLESIGEDAEDFIGECNPEVLDEWRRR